ncbi:MAG: nuclear transport factor 2 family protein [Gemmataceae bacterium]
METVSIHPSTSENFIDRLAVDPQQEISEAREITSTATNLERLQDCYRRIAHGDFTAMTALMADNVEMEFVGPSEVPIAGRWQGKKSVQAASEANFVQLADQQANLIGIAAPGNDVILFAKEQGRVRANGATYNLCGRSNTLSKTG